MENILFGKSKSTEDLINNVKKELGSLPRLSGNRCIYRVPKRLRSVNEKAYTPQVVSIGPLHHGAEGLKSMEEQKMKFLRDYLKRNEILKDLEYYVSIVKNQEEKLRSFYAEHIGFSSDEFVKIILVDAVFIIELILKHDPQACETNNEPNYVMESPWMVDDIMPDLLLLENQLPLFILEGLYDPKTVTYDGMTLSFASLSKLLFTNLLDPEPSKTNFFNPESNKDNSLLTHLIDLLINSGVPENQQFGELAEGTALSLPTATKLHQAGVKFEVSKGKKLLDIQFSNGVLQIPKLRIVDSTEAKIRNLIAFEQCHDRVNRCVSHYVVLMGSLIDKSEDVELLVKFRIIENRIGDINRVVTLINKLGDGVLWNHKKFMFAEIFSQLNEHYNVPWNNHKANLKQNYFNTPWTTLSVTAAALIVILTFIQTVCSIISVVKG